MYVSGDNPYAALGLPVREGLCDDDVRAAWRRIAAATHPDRADGGDPARFAAAAAAYATLRTGYGRGEAYADLHEPPPGSVAPADSAGADSAGVGGVPAPGSSAAPGGSARRVPGGVARRVRGGRPAVLGARLLLASGVCWACVAVAGWQPATLAISVGVLTWLVRTTRHDLAW